MTQPLEWDCPRCGSRQKKVLCEHGARDTSGPPFYVPLYGSGLCVWYAGRLLHLTAGEVSLLRAARGCEQPISYGTDHLTQLMALGFVEISPSDSIRLTGEGENLCRHASIELLDPLATEKQP